MTTKNIKYSIIVLLEREHQGFTKFIENLHNVFSDRGSSFEIIIMGNNIGSSIKKYLFELRNLLKIPKAYDFKIKTTLSVCFKAALKESNGDIIVAVGYYQQVTNKSFNQLLDSFDDKTDLICPWRQNRTDPLIKQIQSRAFNNLVRWIIKDNLHDLNCTVRIFRKKIMEEIEIYGNMYRYFPILASQKGFKVREIKCQHFEEPNKNSFFHLSDYISRLVEILTLFFNIRYTEKPFRFFSFLGFMFFLAGLIIMTIIFGQKFFYDIPIGNRAVLLFAILSMFSGVLAGSFGLLGEILAFIHGRHKVYYAIEKKI